MKIHVEFYLPDTYHWHFFLTNHDQFNSKGRLKTSVTHGETSINNELPKLRLNIYRWYFFEFNNIDIVTGTTANYALSIGLIFEFSPIHISIVRLNITDFNALHSVYVEWWVEIWFHTENKYIRSSRIKIPIVRIQMQTTLMIVFDL